MKRYQRDYCAMQLLLVEQRQLVQRLDDVLDEIVSLVGRMSDHASGHHHTPESCESCRLAEIESLRACGPE